MKKRENSKVEEVRRWFETAVTYEGEPYVMDDEQVAAVIDDNMNTIVVARAGSGKTRTIVAKMVYLIAKCGLKAEEIMAFVFNANAAAEINMRLGQMRVDGKPIVEGEVKVAQTFHAFARRVVFDVCDGRKRCGKILAGEKEDYMMGIADRMLRQKQWADKIWRFMGSAAPHEDLVASSEEVSEDINGVGLHWDHGGVEEQDLARFAKMMTLFVNRAQQKYLAGENTLSESVKVRMRDQSIGERERLFVELGTECYRRYHWYLLDAKKGLTGFCEYGTDFNLIVSWASKLISGRGREVTGLLGGKKYILIDEYQDFSQLFLSVVLAMREVVPGVRLFVVGDDWQAINRFAGSEVEYFRNFERYFGEGCQKYEITTNYRCDSEVVNAARRFMRKAMREKGDFRAFSRKYGKVTVVNPLETELGYALVPYDTRVSEEDKILKAAAMKMGRATVKRSIVQYLKAVVEVVRANVEAGEILILHRNNETSFGVSLAGFGVGLKWALDKLGIIYNSDFDARVRLMTMHKSKGLEAEVVIILEADEGVIPKTHPDTRLFSVFGETEEVALDDQKRLFYVAMTRAKRRLYIISEGGGFMRYLR